MFLKKDRYTFRCGGLILKYEFLARRKLDFPSCRKIDFIASALKSIQSDEPHECTVWLIFFFFYLFQIARPGGISQFMDSSGSDSFQRT